MENLFFRNGVLHYYGNPAGYQSGKVVYVDSIFNKEELVSYVVSQGYEKVEVRDGVYDRLSETGDANEIEEVTGGRRIKIYQLLPNTSILIRFVSLAEREKRGFDGPKRDEYILVYEGEVKGFSLEDIWEKYNHHLPNGMTGHALSISDVLELIEEGESRFFYVEPTGFTEIEFM